MKKQKAKINLILKIETKNSKNRFEYQEHE